jgi:AraC-like DNA-binding protein
VRRDPLPPLRELVRARFTAPTRAARRPFSHGGAGRISAATATRERISRLARELIRERHASPDLTLAGVAAAIPVAPRTLQHILAAEGVGFAELLRAARIEHATEIVLRVEHRGDVGRLVGYRHENHFASAFERAVGVTPSVLERAIRALVRYEGVRLGRRPESTRALAALERRMGEDAALVQIVERRLSYPTG